ncbi:DUF3305 domain-containing protein [Prosthecomicrobium sp. N25]|uniref:DUF3305 domain-containing protein n=1 Tax=Prosthecomicrobium sp. N25 TaxID=3129254 RepID=UPI0030781C19
MQDAPTPADPRVVLLAGLVVGRVQPTSRWGEVLWRPVALLPAPAEAAPWTPLGIEGLTERFYAGPVSLSLHRTETAYYRDNLESGAPRIWVALRPDGAEPPVEVVAVTLDPAEGEALTEAGDQVVDVVPMPAEIAAALAAYVAEHHVERAFVKRRRDRADPEALALRTPATPACGIDGE